MPLVTHHAGIPVAIRLLIAYGVLSLTLLFVRGHASAKDVLPIEPDLSTRIDELYDHEARLFLILYSLKGDGQVDYVTGRMVQEYARSNFGNPVYQTEIHPLFYWWNHNMWNDPEQDGVNGNERIYQENVEFDISRYKPCTFNGQPC
ncbi:MAG TPA: hypothetical protein VJL88_04250 [Nitrospira sp.]|nr:hypothetical protein [Nitrospira sp.]